MNLTIKGLLAASALTFLVGALGNIMQLSNPEAILLWPPIAWWRCAIYFVALAMALVLDQRLRPRQA